MLCVTVGRDELAASASERTTLAAPCASAHAGRSSGHANISLRYSLDEEPPVTQGCATLRPGLDYRGPSGLKLTPSERLCGRAVNSCERVAIGHESSGESHTSSFRLRQHLGGAGAADHRAFGLAEHLTLPPRRTSGVYAARTASQWRNRRAGRPDPPVDRSGSAG